VVEAVLLVAWRVEDELADPLGSLATGLGHILSAYVVRRIQRRKEQRRGEERGHPKFYVCKKQVDINSEHEMTIKGSVTIWRCPWWNIKSLIVVQFFAIRSDYKKEQDAGKKRGEARRVKDDSKNHPFQMRIRHNQIKRWS
jgi:hypothetical protein